MGKGANMPISVISYSALVAMKRTFSPFFSDAVDDADHDHRAAVAVVPAVEDQGAKRGVGISLGRRDVRDDRLEDVVDADAGLGARRDRARAVEPDDVFDFAAACDRDRPTGGRSC